MDLRICLTCGYIWDAGAELYVRNACILCRVAKRPDDKIGDLGQIILKLRHENLLHHGKLK